MKALLALASALVLAGCMQSADRGMNLDIQGEGLDSLDAAGATITVSFTPDFDAGSDARLGVSLPPGVRAKSATETAGPFRAGEQVRLVVPVERAPGQRWPAVGWFTPGAPSCAAAPTQRALLALGDEPLPQLRVETGQTGDGQGLFVALSTPRPIRAAVCLDLSPTPFTTTDATEWVGQVAGDDRVLEAVLEASNAQDGLHTPVVRVIPHPETGLDAILHYPAAMVESGRVTGIRHTGA